MASEDKTQVSIRIPTATLSDLERIARALDRDRTWVMLRAFQVYLDGEGGHALDELDGIEQLDAGRAVDFDVVMDKADAIIAGTRSSGNAKVA